jgi:hypothetical protein
MDLGCREQPTISVAKKSSAFVTETDADRIAFCRTAPSLRLIAFATFVTGVFALNES